MTHYLVDYENISDAELQNIGELPEESCVHIFYSANKAKISLDSLSAIDMYTLKTIKVNPGKQALDMQLVSYLGSLIGMDKARKDDYCIVSKDRDYECVIKFWKSYRKVEIQVINFKKEAPSRQRGANPMETRTANRAMPAAKVVAASKAASVNKASTSNQAENAAVEVKALHKTNTSADDKPSQKAPAPVGVSSHNVANTSVDAKFSHNIAASPAEGKTQADSKADDRANDKQEAKPEHKVTEEELAFVEELIKEQKGESNQRQRVYIGIIGKYGQKKGLSIYKQIKGRIK